MRRVERRVPATSGTTLARLDRVPAARRDPAGPRLRIGFHPDGGTPHLDGAADGTSGTGGRVPYVGGARLGDHLPRIVGATGTLLPAGEGLFAGGSTGHVGSTVGGAGLRVRLIASTPAGCPGPRTSSVLARRRARAGRRRLTVG